MDGIGSQRRLNKRPHPHTSGEIHWPNKKPSELVNIVDDDVEKVYKFRVLLPNGTTLGLKIRKSGNEMAVEELIEVVKQEYFRFTRQTESQKPKRRINWKSDDLCFVDAFEKKITKTVNFSNFETNKQHILRLHDGSKEAETYENMWDLTPDTDLLKELPEEYTFETALADLIDNSLQAVWSNGVNERRLVSVEIVEDRISIFDSGPGMDGSKNSIVKWGKMGASLHRSSRGEAIGGKPPYLMPFFGMFGYGGPIASMHLGRRALVSSKTKESKKVYSLYLERDALLSSASSEQTWMTNGGLRDPSEDEMHKSPDGNFTKVEIFEPKMRNLDISQLQCKLKDIYFPYIQCDEVSNKGKTIMPIEFQVNGIDLAEIEGGEVAITNLHSCNGPEFVLELHFYFNQDTAATTNPGLRAFQEANARLKCVYFPIVEGKESIESILEKLEAGGCGITESYDNFNRVSIRRLGRLLPDARWAWLPYMEPRQRKGDKAQLLKRCCLRVKCFIETDAGFNPTPSKTDLAHHHPYTTALKNFGNKPLEKEKGVHVEIYKDGKPLTLLQLERQYQEWILQMHDQYDEEIDCGEDPPLHIVGPANRKGLCISSDVVRVHKVIWRKGTSWKFGQKVKVLKGACAGCHKNNIYATLEYILVEGFQGDAGGEARLICRPLGVPDENGCLLELDHGNASIDMRGSISLPISVIDSEKCLPIETAEWDCQLEKQLQKAPSSIDILGSKHCQELEVGEALPVKAIVDAGHVPPTEIVAVVRPTSFYSASASKNLDQKYIVKESFEMALQIKFRAEDGKLQDDNHIYSVRVTSAIRKGFHGLYIFPLRCKLPRLFQKAGFYTFSFSIRESSCQNFEKSVQVKALSAVERWGLLSDEQSAACPVRVGSCFPEISIACYDTYNNRIPFTRVPELMVKISSKGGLLAHVHKMNVSISKSKKTLRVKDLRIESHELDKIRPSYKATLMICSQDESFSVLIPFQVIPGSLERVTAQQTNIKKHLFPGTVIKELVLEMFDAYGNHVKEGAKIILNVDGFCLQDKACSIRKVDDRGCVDLSGLLKVTEGFGKNVSLSVISDKKVVFTEEFQTEKRELISSRVPKFCAAGSHLENTVFEIINPEGVVDESIHDEETCSQSHTLVIKSESMDTDDSVRYSFRHGSCVVRTIPLPEKEGIFSFVAAHSRYPELHLTIEVHVEQAPKVEQERVQSQSPDGKILLLQDSSAFKSPKALHDNVRDQCLDGKILLLQDSSAPKDLENLVGSIMNDQKELEEDVLKYGFCIGELENKLNMLYAQQVAIEQDMSKLQASMDIGFRSDLGHITEKEVMMERIECKGDSAAAVVCKLFRAISFQEQYNNFGEHILGVVALLGIVKTNKLSRILAEYLGEDQMLAVVCKSYEAAGTLEKYEQNGNVNCVRALHAWATELGKSVNGRYLVICLEDIRPFSGELGSDPQRLLPLPNPTLPNGKTPAGYLGYAVNMIYLDVHHVHKRTAAGYGLRETLFYRLFGELQVYETREFMKMAHSCITHGAVSLDGGIMRGNGMISLGCWEPDIHFPVVAAGSQINPSPQSSAILMQIEAKKLKLREIRGEIAKETKTHNKCLKKFNKKRDRCYKFLDEKGSLLGSLEYRSNMNGSSYSPC